MGSIPTSGTSPDGSTRPAWWSHAAWREEGRLDEARRDGGAGPRPPRALGHGRGRGRGHRRGRGPRRGRPRLRRPPARAERLRQGHLQPLDQARPRRRALPGAGQRLPRDGGAQGARPPAPERPPPRQRPRLRRAELRVVGGAVLRGRPEGLQPARRPLRLRDVRDPLPRRDAGAAAHHTDGRAARRRRLLRRAVRRRAAAGQHGHHRGRAGGGARQLRAGDRPHARPARLRGRRRRPRPRERPGDPRRGPGGDQRGRPLLRRGAAARGPGPAPPRRSQPGHPPRLRRRVPPGRGGDHGAAHERRAGDVRDPVARPHGGGHDRHADRGALARAAGARGGDRLRPRDGEPLPAATPHASRRPERVRRHPTAGAVRRCAAARPPSPATT